MTTDSTMAASAARVRKLSSVRISQDSEPDQYGVSATITRPTNGTTSASNA
ncbi:Uncharacterised protein [Mycobacteroides abscessus subsp. abscessus]|nr:Uncharacterised protein [Mycobacteroides abscessus subsp. abscessus]